MPTVKTTTLTGTVLRFTRAELVATLAAAAGVTPPDMEEAEDAITLNYVRVGLDAEGEETFANISTLTDATDEFLQVTLTDRE